MINDAAVASPFRYKYVDDLTLLSIHSKDQPSSLQEQVSSIDKWASENNMIINETKSKVMHVKISKSTTNTEEVNLRTTTLQAVENAKLLGITLSSNLRWDKNVQDMTKKASKRLHMLRLAKRNGVPSSHLLSIFKCYIRPSLEYCAPLWHHQLTRNHNSEIERIQKRALRIILGTTYTTYTEALQRTDLPSLESRRELICRTFSQKLQQNTRLRDLLPSPRKNNYGIRSTRRFTIKTRTARYFNSCIPQSINVLNNL